MSKKTYKDIEASRNKRLWITEVCIPVVTAGAMLYSNENIRRRVDNVAKFVSIKAKEKTSALKEKFKEFKEKEES